jgi:hypothetical protein
MFVRLKHMLMIRTGILGTSETAHHYVEKIKESDQFELTGCYSPDYYKSKTFAAEYDLIAYPTPEALFNYTDALVITDFSPDFLLSVEKSLKNFKHVLITNPFLAGFEEIQYLRKLSEESKVLFQIAGGFYYHHLYSSDINNDSTFYADLKHTFKIGENICKGFRFMEVLLHDISLLLQLMKGLPKKNNTATWDMRGSNPDLMSTRLELDNGHTANILFSQIEDTNRFTLSWYHAGGVSKIDFDTIDPKMIHSQHKAVQNELDHFSNSIQMNKTANLHNDIVFQALELVHSTKEKAVRYFTSNVQF